MSNLVTYLIDNARANFPEGKVAERNPNRFVTVAGTFYRATVAEDGTLSKGDKLTYSTKSIDRNIALAEGFSLDLANGTLTMPEGERGRKPTASVSQDAITAALDALRTPAKK